MCCLLIAGLQLLGEDLKAGGGRAARSEVGVVGVVWEGDTFFFFLSVLSVQSAHAAREKNAQAKQADG